MFHYPLPYPRGTAYQRLGVGPEATAEEISEAKLELTLTLKSQKQSIDRQLDAVYQQVEGLRETYGELEGLLGQGENADDALLRTAQARLAELEQRAREREPSFPELREKAREIERQIHEVNLIALQSAEERLKYDRDNPPLELLKLADCARDIFSDTRLALYLVRRELSSFFASFGETVLHPSDLTREDFTSDFTPNRVLDGPQP